MKRYLTIFFRFLKLSWAQNIEYRADFVTWMVIDSFWGIMDAVFAVVLVGFTKTIGDWSLGQMLIVSGIFRLMVIPIWGWMFQSFSLLPKSISEGRLDLILTKPADSQFLVSVQRFGFSILPSLLAGGSLFVSGLKISHSSVSLPQALILFWLLIVSCFFIYSVYFLTMTLTLFVERLDNVYHIFTSLYDVSRFPSEIYSWLLQRIFTTVVPIALLIVVPANTIFQTLTLTSVTQFHLLAILFFTSGRLIWQSGLRRYSSASS